MRRIALLLVVVAVSTVACLGEQQTNTYPSTIEARSDGVFERGWLPDVLPNDAGPIVEFHDLDTNRRCSVSDFPAAGVASVIASLNGAGFEAYQGTLPKLPSSRCPFSRLEALSGESEFVGYRSKQRDSDIAVVSGGRLFLWSSSMKVPSN